MLTYIFLSILSIFCVSIFILKNFVYFDKIKTNLGGALTSLAQKIAAAKKEAAKARAGKNSFPPTPFLFARPSVPFWFCRAKRGNHSGFCSK
jgi:hypothetical protein